MSVCTISGLPPAVRNRMLARRAGSASRTAASDATPVTKVRFVAKGLKSQRDRLGLSAAEFGKLIGVSAQSVYNWEGGQTRPRDEQMILARLDTLVPDWRERDTWTCGPTGLLDAAEAHWADAGITGSMHLVVQEMVDALLRELQLHPARYG